MNRKEIVPAMNKGALPAESILQIVQTVGIALRNLPVLGPAVWLCSQDVGRKNWSIADVEKGLIAPVLLDQCRLLQRGDIPVAFITWAKVNDALDSELRAGHRCLSACDWSSGEHVWIMDIIAPFGNTDETKVEIERDVFGGRVVTVFKCQ